MAYFPHAYQKMLAGTDATPFDKNNGTNDTLDLVKGEIGLMDARTKLLVDINPGTPTYAAHPMIILAQGSFHTSDTLGGSLHGGYQETVKSKGINPKYVSKFYKVLPSDPVNQVVQVSAEGCELPCNTTYWLRVDIKGSPALRFLTHNAYLTVSGFTGCCNTAEDPVDPNVILLQWADAINASPLINPFVQATVWDDVTAQAPITATAASATSITVTASTNLAAGQRVIFTPSVTPTATAWTIVGKTLTLTTVDANTLFTVGMVIADANGTVSAGTKIISRTLGDGNDGTIFTINTSHNTSSVTGGNLTSASDAITYVKTGYTTNVIVPLVMANNVYTTSGTEDICAINVTALTTVQFYEAIDTDTYTALTTGVDDVISFIEFIGAYVGTTFGDCSFEPKDHFEKEPVQIYPSIVDESGDPCNVNCFSVAEIVTPYQGKGYGETLIRELILAKSYQQEHWNSDPRMREVMDNTTLDEITRTDRYHVYHILHSVPRKSNPTGIMDNDQYLIKIVLSDAGYADANTNLFEIWMNAWLLSSGNHVQLEVLA